MKVELAKYPTYKPSCRIPDDHKDAYETGLAENRTSPS